MFDKTPNSGNVGKLRLSCTVVGNEHWCSFLEWSLPTEINFCCRGCLCEGSMSLTQRSYPQEFVVRGSVPRGCREKHNGIH